MLSSRTCNRQSGPRPMSVRTWRTRDRRGSSDFFRGAASATSGNIPQADPASIVASGFGRVGTPARKPGAPPSRRTR